MAKQTFTTGQVLTAAQVNSLQANDFNQTVSVKTANYTLVAADKGTRIEFNTSGSVTCTVNTGLFDAGDTVIIQNRGAGTVTVTAGTATVNTNASLAVAQYGYGTLYFISASASIFFADAGGIPASAFTAKGDILVGTGSGTYDDLAVGTNGYTLVADSGETTGLKWAAPASGGMTSLATGTLSGSSVALNSISGSYNNLELHISGWNTGGGRLYLRINGDTGSNYTGGYVRQRDGVGLVAQYANSPGQTAEIRSDGDVTSDSGATNTVIFRLPNYTATAGAKVVEAIAYTLSTYKIPAYSFWGYTGTAGAITSLTIVGTSNFTAGTYTLWGVK